LIKQYLRAKKINLSSGMAYGISFLRASTVLERFLELALTSITHMRCGGATMSIQLRLIAIIRIGCYVIVV
jgi:hypothetical protein